MKYIEVSGNHHNPGLCSDDACPCGYPGATISRGEGFIYVSAEVADFRADCLAEKAAEAKIRRRLGAHSLFMSAGCGVFAPILMCKRGAEKRGLDLAVAAEDARHWWRTGKVPCRPTPLAGSETKNSTETANRKKSRSALRPLCICSQCETRYALGVNSVVVTSSNMTDALASGAGLSVGQVPPDVPDGVALIYGMGSWPEGKSIPSAKEPVQSRLLEDFQEGKDRNWRCEACKTVQPYDWNLWNADDGAWAEGLLHVQFLSSKAFLGVVASLLFVAFSAYLFMRPHQPHLVDQPQADRRTSSGPEVAGKHLTALERRKRRASQLAATLAERETTTGEKIEAVEDLIELGPVAVPAMIDLLQSGDDVIDLDSVAQEQGAEPPPAEVAIELPDGSSLEVKLDQDGLPSWARITLANIGGPAVVPLQRLVHDQNPRTQLLARKLLKELDQSVDPARPPTPENVAEWVGAAIEADPPVSAFALTALKQIDSEAAAVVMDSCHEHPPWRKTISGWLEHEWFPLEPIISSYTSGATDDEFRRVLGEALLNRELDVERTIPPLADYLKKQKSGEEALVAVTLLARYAEQLKQIPREGREEPFLSENETVSLLLHCAGFQSDEARERATAALVSLGDITLDHALPLTQRFTTDSRYYRSLAPVFHVLQQIGAGNARVREAMCEVLRRRLGTSHFALSVLTTAKPSTQQDWLQLIDLLHSSGNKRYPIEEFLQDQEPLPLAVLVQAFEDAVDGKKMHVLRFTGYGLAKRDSPPMEFIRGAVELLAPEYTGETFSYDKSFQDLGYRFLAAIGFDNVDVQDELLKFYDRDPDAVKQLYLDYEDEIPLTFATRIARQYHAASFDFASRVVSSRLREAFDRKKPQHSQDEVAAVRTVFIKALESKSSEIRYDATSVLYYVARSQESVHPETIDRLEDILSREEAPKVREEIEDALREFRELPESALPGNRGDFRTWTDSSGKFTVEARLVRVSENIATLMREDGRQIDIPLAKLSPKDTEFIEETTAD